MEIIPFFGLVTDSPQRCYYNKKIKSFCKIFKPEKTKKKKEKLFKKFIYQDEKGGPINSTDTNDNEEIMK